MNRVWLTLWRLVALAAAGFLSTGCYTFASVGSGELAVVHTPNGVEKNALAPGD